MSAIPAIVQNKKCLAYFIKADAIGEKNAKTLDELVTKMIMPLKRMLKISAIAEADGKYYITDKFSKTIRFKNLTRLVK